MSDRKRAFLSATAGYFAFFQLWGPYILLSSPGALDEASLRTLGTVLLGGIPFGLTGLVMVIGIPFWLAAFAFARLAGPWLERRKGLPPLILSATGAGALIGGLGSTVLPSHFATSYVPGVLAGMIAGALAALLFHVLRPKPTPELSMDTPA